MDTGSNTATGSRTEAQLIALRRLAAAIVGMIAEVPEGIPGGTIYAALMTHGCTFEQYEQIMGGLVNAKLVRKVGQHYLA